MTRAELVADLQVWASDWAAHPTSPADPARFTARQEVVVHWQRAHIAAYAAYAGIRSLPAHLPPLVPVTALKVARLYSDDVPEPPPVLFHTSGTSDGQPGRVAWHDTAAYDAVIDAVTQHWLIPEPKVRFRVVSLIPGQDVRPHSSLGHMAARISARWGDGLGGTYLHNALDLVGLRHALADACVDHVPVLILATSLAIEAWMAAWPASDVLVLPRGSRLMDTGGPKGRTLMTERSLQHDWLARQMGLDPDFIVGELGMTELSSPRFETTLRARLVGDVPAMRAYAGPPWLRTVVLDPTTRAPVPDGDVGMLAHIDLANIDSVACLLTADLGRIERLPGGQEAVVLQGRIPGAEWRGCGLDVEWLLG